MLPEQNKIQGSDMPVLKAVYFYLTSYCNLNCLHCWISPEYIDKKEAPREADLSLLQDIINQAIPLGLKAVKITGGEPFLSKNVFRLISYASGKNLHIIMETNATLIDEAGAKFMKENSVKQIAVSLDGPNREIHEKIRNKKGCFELTVNGLRLLKKYGLNVQVIMSLCRHNAGCLEETITFAEQLGANSFKINCISDISRGKSFRDKGMSLTAAEYIAFNKKIEEEIQPRHKIRIIFDIPPAFKRLENIKNGRGRCGIKNILGVMGDGSISICGIGEVLSSLRLGDLKKESLKEIWGNNKVLGIIREGLPSKLEGICGRCIFKALCLGKCRAEAYYKSNNFMSPFSFCEEADRLGLFPKSRIFNKKEGSNE